MADDTRTEGHGSAPPPWPHPGVIPWAPLSVGDILGGALTTMRRYGKHLLGIGVIAYGTVAVAVIAGYGIAYEAGLLNGLLDAEQPGEGPTATLALIGVGAIAAIGLLLATATVCTASATVLQEAVVGRPIGWAELWHRTLERLPSVTMTVLVSGLLLAIPAGLFGVAALVALFSLLEGDGKVSPLVPSAILIALVLAGPAFWLAVRFSLAPAVAVFERQSAATALRRSSLLVRGVWWRTFGIALLALLVASAVALLLRLVLSAVRMLPGEAGEVLDTGSDPSFAAALIGYGPLLLLGVLGQLIHQMLITVLPQLALGVLYVDRRLRTEQLGPALAAAAMTRADDTDRIRSGA
ncbi:hypothetical protein [Streptomyces sp. NPDC005953]|uniref:hypothetical protein n=1 Tax=Streptomyces sp. NPDC005953 TaxID=3156719 RepID=UPI0033EE7032